MKYIWIGMIAIIEFVGLMATMIDIFRQIKTWEYPFCLDFIDWKSKAFIILNLCALFLYSLSLWGS